MPKLRKSSTILVTMLPIVSQKCWKKRGGMPLGLGDFKGYICFSAIQTSLPWKSLVSKHLIHGPGDFRLNCIQ